MCRLYEVHECESGNWIHFGLKPKDMVRSLVSLLSLYRGSGYIGLKCSLTTVFKLIHFTTDNKPFVRVYETG